MIVHCTIASADMYESMYESICNAPLLQPKQSRKSVTIVGLSDNSVTDCLLDRATCCRG